MGESLSAAGRNGDDDNGDGQRGHDGGKNESKEGEQ
jgi:hypothetical protein